MEDEKLQEAITLKDKGNELVKEKKLEEAKVAYSAAIDLVPTNELFWSNRSMVYFQMKDGVNALSDAEKCIAINPNWGRGYSRKVNALQLLGRHEEIIETCRKGLAVEQSDALVKNLTIACLELLEGKFWGTTSQAQGAYEQELEFSKDRSILRVRFFGQEIECTYHIDPTTSPMTMIIEMPQQPPMLHIFQFTEQGIDLVSPGPSGSNPTAFEGDGLIELKRGAQPEEPEDLSLRELSPPAKLALYVEEAIKIVPTKLGYDQAEGFLKIIQFQKNFYRLRIRFGQETSEMMTRLLQNDALENVPQELLQRIQVLRNKMREAGLFEGGPEDEEPEGPATASARTTNKADSSSTPSASVTPSETKEAKEQPSPVNSTPAQQSQSRKFPIKMWAALIATSAVAAVAVWHFFGKGEKNATNNNSNK